MITHQYITMMMNDMRNKKCRYDIPASQLGQTLCAAGGTDDGYDDDENGDDNAEAWHSSIAEIAEQMWPHDCTSGRNSIYTRLNRNS